MIMRYYSIITLLHILLLIQPDFCQKADKDFDLEKPDAVVLLDESEFQIIQENKAKFKVHRIIRINNPPGKEHGRVVIQENKFIKCSKISGAIFDLDGAMIKKLRSDEIHKTSISPGYIFYDDDKYQAFELGLSTFPYVIEYAYESEYSSLLFWPDWCPQSDLHVLKSTYTLTLERPIGYRTHFIGFHVDSIETNNRGKRVITWQKENIEPRLEEDFMPSENDLQMALWFAPVNFQIGRSVGSLASWRELASWYRGLFADRYVLSDDAKLQIANVLAGSMSEKEKIQKLYSFLQYHTRYVAIELGLSSWQPQSAQSVMINGYGDCKDLTTLMVTMLSEAGIKAYPALIRTREHGMLIDEFPHIQFNHCITFIPLADDTLWLECTANYITAGEIPSDAEGCGALIIKENDYKILTTPVSHSAMNQRISKIEGRLTGSGGLSCSGNVSASGNMASEIRAMFNSLKPEERKRRITHLLGQFAPKFDLQDYDVNHLTENFNLPVEIHFKGTIDRYGISSANRIFINPNLLVRQSIADIPEETERKFPVDLGFAFTEIDSIIIALPDGYVLEAAPDTLMLKTNFGSFRSGSVIEDGKIKFKRELIVYQRYIPVIEYDQYISFMKNVIKSDQAKYVFKRSTQ